MLQTLLQFISIVHLRLIDLVFDDALYLVGLVDRVEVRTVLRPQIRWNESRRCCCSRSRTVSDLPKFELLTFAR